MTPVNDDQYSPTRIEALAVLTHNRWALPLLAACAASPMLGLKHATLLHRLGVGRESLGRTLAAVIAQGWIMSNPGVGHALRPEYVLTDPGRRIGPTCIVVLAELRRLDLEDLGSQKWTLPIVASVLGRVSRFGEIRRCVQSASPRAISLCLREIEDVGLVRRTVREAYPPVPEYALTKRALRLAAVVRRLVQEIGLRPTPRQQRPLERRRMTAG